jgi:hypothetical protein
MMFRCGISLVRLVAFDGALRAVPPAPDAPNTPGAPAAGALALFGSATPPGPAEDWLAELEQAATSRPEPAKSEAATISPRSGRPPPK